MQTIEERRSDEILMGEMLVYSEENPGTLLSNLLVTIMQKVQSLHRQEDEEIVTSARRSKRWQYTP